MSTFALRLVISSHYGSKVMYDGRVTTLKFIWIANYMKVCGGQKVCIQREEKNLRSSFGVVESLEAPLHLSSNVRALTVT